MAVKEKYDEHTKGHLCNSQFGPRHQKADHIIAILLELDITFAIPMIFHHLGPNRWGGRGKNYFIFAIFFAEPVFA